MRTLDYKDSAYGIYKRRLFFRGFILVVAAFGFLKGVPLAGAALDENVPQENGMNSRQLEWSADKMQWNPTESIVVLNGNVKIIQGKTVIVADNAQIFSTKNADAEQMLGPDAVDKFIASGNVRIEIELGVATSERAIYFKETKLLKLSGTPAKFVSGDNTITGSTITVDRETGKITVDNAKAVTFPEDDL